MKILSITIVLCIVTVNFSMATPHITTESYKTNYPTNLGMNLSDISVVYKYGTVNTNVTSGHLLHITSQTYEEGVKDALKCMVDLGLVNSATRTVMTFEEMSSICENKL